MSRRKLLLAIGILFVPHLSAQQFGGNPPSLKWKQINTDTARIIFPAGLELQAKQVATMVHALSKATLNTIGTAQRKINIVFQNQTTIANGYVGVAPFRSEFQLTADQNSFDLGSLPWQQQLVIHEYRHVEQYNNFRVGLSKAFYYLFGEGGQAFANSLSVPNWLFEGDAVYQETLVSNQGRGRLPYFFNGYRSLWAGDKKYSYMKLRNGSLRDYTPDHYPLGYMLVAYGREKYGDDFWKKVSFDAASFKGLFYPLQKAIKKYSGVSFNQFREDAFQYFSAQIKKDGAIDSSAIYAREHKHFAADEEFPQFIDDNNIVYVKTTYKKIPAFTIRNLNDGREKRIAIKAVSLDSYFSYRNNKIVYAAYEPDLRWGWRDYGVIRLFDMNTGTDKRVTSRTKYFSPDISDDGKHIIAVQVAVNGKATLHLLNSETGLLEKSIPNKDSLFYTYPKFYNNNQVAVAVRNTKGEMSLCLIDINGGNVEYLTPFSMNVIGFVSVKKDTIYFGASHDKLDCLFAFAGNQLYRLDLPNESLSTGNYQIQSSNGRYAWTTFTAVGYKMSVSANNGSYLKAIDADGLKQALTTQDIHSLEHANADLLDKTTVKNYNISPYSESFHLFNFHSWRPYITDPDYMLALESENILNTFQSDIYFDYNRNEKYKQIGIDLDYGQLFTVLDAGTSYTFDRNDLYKGNIVYWNEAQARIGLSVPLNLSKGKHFTSLQIGDELVYNQRYFQGNYKDTFSTKGYAYTLGYLNFANQSQQATQQIYPSFAQTLSLAYDRAFTNFQGNQFLASSYFYFPGIVSTHSLVLSAAFQQHDSIHQISFSNSFPFSRGYSAENFYRMYGFTGNYNFPLAYPDWGFGDIVYFLRIRSNLFFDYTKVLDFFNNGSPFNQEYKSFGTEIFFDTKWWNQLNVSFGFRYSHLLDPDFLGLGPNRWEFILPINLLSK